MPEPWQIFPDAVLEEDALRQQAGDWAIQQRQELADAWAEEQRRQLEEWRRQAVAMQQRQLAELDMGQPQAAPVPSMDITPPQPSSQPSIPVPGVQGGTVSSSVPPVTPPFEIGNAVRLGEYPPAGGGIGGALMSGLELAGRPIRALNEALAYPYANADPNVTERYPTAGQGEAALRVLRGETPGKWGAETLAATQPDMPPLARQILGIASDMTLDPLNWPPGAAIPQTAQLAGMLGKGAVGLAARGIQAAAPAIGRAAEAMAPTGRKLLTNEVGALDLGGQGLGEAANAPPYYSQLEKVINDARQPKATGQQWSGFIKANGVKPDEMKWTGADDFLAENAGKSVTKQELADWVAANKVDVREVVLGGNPEQQLTYGEMGEYNRLIQARDQGENLSGTQLATLQDLESKIASRPSYSPSKFSGYQLPGGENYRELVLTLPEKQVPNPSYGKYAGERQFVTPSELAGISTSYISTHYPDIPNPLAHIRFNDRVGADGKKVLFIEEIQSDWHQAGRERGYISSKPLTELPQGFTTIQKLGHDGELGWTVSAPNGDSFGHYKSQDDAIANFLTTYGNPDAVPQAPFSKTWPDLALKRMFKWAADNGYDRVAWTTGKQQTARYEDRLRMVADELRWMAGPVDRPGVLTVIKDGKIKHKLRVMPEELASQVGKDAAYKLLGESTVVGHDYGEPIHSISGSDLTVGGEGMKGFYDVMLPEIANKIAKKFGGRVGTSEITISAGNREQATVHSLDLTDAMRTTARAEGFPLFTRPGTVGAVAGGLTGATQGDTPQERTRNALIGAGAGALGAEGIALAPRAIKASAPMAGKLLREESGQLMLPGFAPPVKPARVSALQAPGPAKGVGNEYWWDRIRNITERQGPVGKQLANKIYQWREDYQKMTGNWTSQMPTVVKLGKTEWNNFIDVAQGKAQAISARVQQAATEWKAVSDGVEQAAKAAGIDMGHIDNYFPHLYDPKYLDKVLNTSDQSQWLATLNHMVTNGYAKDTTEAEGLLLSLRNKIHTRKASNLEISRETNLPGYRRDKAVMGQYLAEASKRISYAEQFGPQHEIANNLLAKIHEGGFDKGGDLPNLFAKATEGALYGYREQRISNVIRGFNVITKLGLGALTNAAQSVNTATVGGGIRTLLKTPYAMRNPAAHDFAVRIGVITDDALNAIREGGGFSGKAMAIGAPGFNNVERFNRTLAAVAGRDLVQELAANAVKGDKLAIRGLEDMRLDPQAIIQRGGQLTQPEIDRGARSLVERTQFLVDAQDLPPWASGPIGRVIMQFRTFSYNQTAFMWRDVLEPALRGQNRDVRPLLRFMIYAPIVGAGVVELQDFLRQRDTSKGNLIDYLGRYYQRVGGLGILGEILTGLNPPGTKYASGERYAMNVAGLALGPSMGTAMQGIAAVPPALGGHPEQLKRFGLRQVPIVGTTLANKLVPYQQQSVKGKFDNVLRGIGVGGQGRFDAVLGR